MKKFFFFIQSFCFIVLAFFCFAQKAHAAIALVQSESSTTEYIGILFNSVSATFDSNTRAGDAIIVFLEDGSHSANAVTSCTDTASSTYVKAASAFDSVADQGSELWYALNIIASTTPTVTCHFNANLDFDAMAIHEYSGIATSSALDATSTNILTTASTALTTGTSTTNFNNELIFGGFVGTDNGDWTFTHGSGFTTRIDNGTTDGLDTEDEIQSSAGPVSAFATASPGDQQTNIMATFEPIPTISAPTNVNGYAWGNKMGWVNFGTQAGGLEVDTTTIVGYVWSQNFGWINLAPASSGVLNDGHGNLSGDAWAQDAGYINFQGVTIDSSGKFHGVASGTIAGSLVFDSSTYTPGTTTVCTYCNVTTTWMAPAVAPLTVSAVNLNTVVGGTNPATITLTANATTSVNVNATITDNSCSQITGGTTTILLYRSGVTSSSCLTSSGNGVSANLNCYTAAAFTASSTCSAGVVNTTTTFPVQYFAQATDASSSFTNQNWIGTVIFTDSTSVTSSTDSTHSTSSNVMATLIALNVTTSSINYGTLAASSTTNSVNQTTTVTDAGNSSTTLQLSATKTLTNGANSIATSSQGYSTSTFTYPGTSTALTASVTTVSGFLLTAPTSTSNVKSTVFWGLDVPPGTATGTYNGINQFTAVFHS